MKYLGEEIVEKIITEMIIMHFDPKVKYSSIKELEELAMERLGIENGKELR